MNFGDYGNRFQGIENAEEVVRMFENGQKDPSRGFGELQQIINEHPNTDVDRRARDIMVQQF